MIRAGVLAAVLLAAVPAFAQNASQRPLRRVELDFGGGLISGAPAGDTSADLVSGNGQPYSLFTTEGELGATPTLHVRLGVALTRRFALEGSMVFGRPELRVSTSADVEGGPAITIAERIDQYFFDGSLLILFDEAGLGPSTLPYVAVGGGYLRQLHEGRVVVEHGQVFHAGGGLKHWMRIRPRGGIRAAGVRADARLYFLRDRIAVDDGPRPHVAISGSVFMVF